MVLCKTGLFERWLPCAATGGSFPFSNKNWQADGTDAKQALAMLDETQKNYKVDAKHILLLQKRK